MRIIGTILLASICCIAGFARQHQSQVKEPSVVQQTEPQTLPEKRLSVLDIAQIQVRLSDALKQQGQPLPVDTEKLRLQGIEIVPETRFVIKDGAIYMLITSDTLMPMNGGGASGCLPKNPKNAGKLIPITSQVNENQAPAKDPAKKN